MKRRSPRATPFHELLSHRLTRRALLAKSAALAPLALAAGPLSGCAAPSAAPGSTLSFKPIAPSNEDAVLLPDGYDYDIVIRWGESLSSRVPDLDASRLNAGVLFEPGAAERQQMQFGQNCDAIHFFPLDAGGDRAVLCVNNEYTDDALMYPGHPGFRGAVRGEGRPYVQKHPGLVPLSQAAQGLSVTEVARERGRWRFVKDSRLNRRITANTPIDIGGPARGAALMRTHADPKGVRALGTMGNCAGGQTPWGTYLTAEENIQDYFANAKHMKEAGVDQHVIESHRRFRMWDTHSLYSWDVVDPRFDLTKTPCEPFRFGWVVEIDPRDPTRTPVKRTALGRFAHEGASSVVAHDGRIAVYMGDDGKFEYVYKFVSRGRFDATRHEANRDLLDDGVLYVARFDAGGGGEWLPLVYDPKGPLNAASGFRDQAEVLIKARAAATLLGATPMDRPEDVEANPVTGRIYIACTRNDDRAQAPGRGVYAGRELDMGLNAANPRADNQFGHIIELREANDDHTARQFTWEVFLLAGDPAGGKLITTLENIQSDSTYFAGYPHAAELSPIGSPDNIGFDRAGNLWVVTDGRQPRDTNDGCWVCPTTGPFRGRLQQFMSGPIGAEICGCCLTPDNETLFLSIQHPGESGTTDNPLSHWPDGGDSQPRSSVIAVRRKDGGVVGS